MESLLFKRIWKVKITILLLIFVSLLITSPSTKAGLWGKKIKEISDNELKEIKTELNISGDPRFHSYRDSDLKRILNKEMDPKKAEGLTYGVYILNAINEENLVNLCSKSVFNDKEATHFFSMLAEDLASWQKNFAEKTTKLAIQGVIEACRMSGLSSGISSVFLAWDLTRINISIKELGKVIRNRALWHYIASRKMGDSHEGAWGSAPVPIKYRNKQTEEYFKSLWNKYGDHVLDSGLDSDFKAQQHEILKTSLLYALGAQPHLVITSPLKITPPPYQEGDEIKAEFTITNRGNLPIFLKAITVGGRYGDEEEIVDFTKRYDIKLDTGESYSYHGTLTLSKAGKYHFFCTYQTADGNWNPSIDLGLGLTDKDRVEDITVKAFKAKRKAYPNRIVDILSLEQWGKIGEKLKSAWGEKYTYIYKGTNKIYIIRKSDNTLVRQIFVGKGYVPNPCTMCIAPDGKYLYVMQFGNKRLFKFRSFNLSIIRASDNTVIDTIKVFEPINCIAINPNGKHLYVGSDTIIWIIRTSDNTVIDNVKLPSNIHIRSISVSPDGKYLYVCVYVGISAKNYKIFVLRTLDYKTVAEISESTKISRKIFITPDGKYLYYGRYYSGSYESGYHICVRRTSDYKIVKNFSELIEPICMSSDGNYIYGYWQSIQSGKKYLYIIRTSDNTIVNTFTTGLSIVYAVTLEGKYLYIPSYKGVGAIIVIRLSDGKVIDKIPMKPPAVKYWRDIIISPNNKYIYAICERGIIVIDTSTNKIIDRIPSHQEDFTNATISGEYFCIGKGNSISIIHIPSGEVIGKISAPADSALVISPDGKYAYVIHKEKSSVSIIRISDNSVIKEIFIGKGCAVYSMSITPDKEYIHVFAHRLDSRKNVQEERVVVIRTSDNKVKIIKIPKQYLRRNYPPSPPPVLTPDGNYLYSTYYTYRGGLNYDIVPAVDIIRTSDNQLVDRIYTRGQPKEMLISPDGKRVYVNYGEETAVVGISGTSPINTVVNTISMKGKPFALASTSDGKHLYVANHDTNTISVVRTSDNTVVGQTFALNTPIALALTPDGKHLYVAHRESNEISVIRTSDNSIITTIDVGGISSDIAITPDGKYAYVVKPYNNTVAVVRISDNKIVNEVSVGGGPISIAITPDGKYAYVSNYKSSTVSLISTSINKTIHEFPVDRPLGRIAITPDGKYAYVAGYDEVVVIQTSDNSRVKEIDVSYPFDVAITPDGKYAYVNRREDYLSQIVVISIPDNTIVDQFLLPGKTGQIIAGLDGKYIYVAGYGANKIFIVKSVSSS